MSKSLVLTSIFWRCMQASRDSYFVGQTTIETHHQLDNVNFHLLSCSHSGAVHPSFRAASFQAFMVLAEVRRYFSPSEPTSSHYIDDGREGSSYRHGHSDTKHKQEAMEEEVDLDSKRPPYLHVSTTSPSVE